MRPVMTQLNLSARAYHRNLRLVRTIPDLAGSEEMQSAHLAEVLRLRSSEIDDCLEQFANRQTACLNDETCTSIQVQEN